MKQEQRKLALAHRNALSKEQVMENSKCICTSLKPFLKARNGIYLSYGNEVDVHTLLSLPHDYAIPKTLANHTLCFYLLDKETQLIQGKHGIWEPDNGEVMKDIEVLIIPLVAFDERCHRLGYGGGYYDRYLKSFKGLRIGVAHECQKLAHISVQAHDESLDMIVSEKQIYKRKD